MSAAMPEDACLQDGRGACLPSSFSTHSSLRFVTGKWHSYIKVSVLRWIEQKEEKKERGTPLGEGAGKRRKTLDSGYELFLFKMFASHINDIGRNVFVLHPVF